MRSFRRFIVALAEVAQAVNVLLWTGVGAWGGARLAQIAIDGGWTGLPPDKAIDFATILGGIIGFAVSATVAALVLAIAQIELNTREVARYYRERRKNEAVIDRAIGHK